MFFHLIAGLLAGLQATVGLLAAWILRAYLWYKTDERNRNWWKGRGGRVR